VIRTCDEIDTAAYIPARQRLDSKTKTLSASPRLRPECSRPRPETSETETHTSMGLEARLVTET